jgi:glycine oxidase
MRPGSFDNAAIVGPTDIDGLVLACGHYRNGILFAPVTVLATLALVEHGELPSWAWPIAAQRLHAPMAEPLR